MSDPAPGCDEPDGDDTTPPNRLSRRHGVLIGALSAAAVALIALSAVFGAQVLHEQAQQHRRQEAVQAARQTVEDLMNISGKNAKQDLARLVQGMTGELKKQFTSRRKLFVQVLERGRVQASGRVVAAGLTQADADSARVLVAARWTVSNESTRNPRSGLYHWVVDLAFTDGRWLASGIESVA